jgi:hypothetical protein
LVQKNKRVREESETVKKATVKKPTREKVKK